MKNNFVANILLCEKFKSSTECEKIFNFLTLEDKHSTNFDIGIFLTSDIEEIKKEMFLVNLVYEGNEKNSGGQFHPLGTYEKECEKEGKASELIVFKDNEVEFKWSGLYTLEFRLCKESKDIDELEIEQMIEWIDKSRLINSLSFYVELK